MIDIQFTMFAPLFAQTPANESLSLSYLLTLLVLAVGILLFFILKLRMQAFLALILASLFVAIGSSES